MDVPTDYRAFGSSGAYTQSARSVLLLAETNDFVSVSLWLGNSFLTSFAQDLDVAWA